MKRVLALILLLVSFCFKGFSQLAGEIFSGSIRNGSASNSVIISIKPSQSFSGQFTNIQFTLQIPDNISPQPAADILLNPLSSFISTSNYTTLTTTENGFYNYLFNATISGGPFTNFTSGIAIDVLEIEFTGGPLGTTAYSRLANLANGGSTNGQMSFYVEVSGNDNTNYTNMFYGNGALNGGSSSTYSYVPIQNTLVPLSNIKFNANYTDNNTLLKWTIENPSFNIDHFEVERSIDGVHFLSIGTNNVNNNNSYQFSDLLPNQLKYNNRIFYRIKEVHTNGQFKISETKSLLLTSNLLTKLFPNPVHDFAELDYELTKPGTSTIKIIDASGKCAKVFYLKSKIGLNQLKISMLDISPGAYYLMVITDDETKELKFVKY
jgi:hypothetical protein